MIEVDPATQAMSSNYVDVTGGRGVFRSIPGQT